ncbi:MAG: MotA/TolQ/ExbB proton channel family protein [Thiotrichales bacterium]
MKTQDRDRVQEPGNLRSGIKDRFKHMHIDLAPLFGVFGAVGIVIWGIHLSGGFAQFVDSAALVIVIGGTFFVTLTQVPLQQFLGAFKEAMRAFSYRPTNPQVLIDEATHLTNIVRRQGILALDKIEIRDPFLRRGVELCIDGYPKDVVHKTLAKDINIELERHHDGVRLFKAMADAAPAMGMIGTLIGLVQMLLNLNDPKAIGPGMAVALLTTLYGALIAYAVANPIAEKLKSISAEERLRKMLILESIASIQDGTNPRVLQQLLTSFLPEEKREMPVEPSHKRGSH